MPSIARRLEEAAPGIRILALIAVADEQEEQHFVTQAELQVTWIHRSGGDATNPGPVLDALRRISFPEGFGFIWIAAEKELARAARQVVVGERSHPLAWVKASAYWSAVGDEKNF